MMVFLAFEQFRLVPLILFFPSLFNATILSSKNSKHAFAWGFFTSFIIMLGGFYWITYVIHEFGDLPWSVSGLLFLAFCGFGALNFPVFAGCAHWLHRTLLKNRHSLVLEGVWVVFGLPALFTIIEWAIPKLFPWYIGHAFYQQLWLIQLCELTGTTFLTFSLYSLGGFIGWLTNINPASRPKALRFAPLPILCFVLMIGFSFWTLKARPIPLGREIKVALIQANIGSLDKLRSEQGVISLVDRVLNTYKDLTQKTLMAKPDLILWPETAIPLELDRPSARQMQVFDFVKETHIPLISGAYGTSSIHPFKGYNSAFLLDPSAESLRVDSYHKNILLAFGEYLPLGNTFPSLYKTFPQVSDFERGNTQNIFTLGDGTRLGISICYEAIVPGFIRKIGRQGVNALINLTNDSWFGPTSEPHLHGALTVFRAIEHRVPLVRVTNTGVSFTVSHLGEMSAKTSVYQPETAVRTVNVTAAASPSFYALYGDWFISILSILLGAFIFSLWRRSETLPL